MPLPRVAAIGIATPLTGDRVGMTNPPLTLSIAALRRELALERKRVINDLTSPALIGAAQALDAT